MRLIGEIEHPRYKISLFRLNERLSIKIEDGQFEQVYKIRENDHLQDAKALTELVDDDFLQTATEAFEKMRNNQAQALQKWLSARKESFQFPDII